MHFHLFLSNEHDVIFPLTRIMNLWEEWEEKKNTKLSRSKRFPFILINTMPTVWTSILQKERKKKKNAEISFQWCQCAWCWTFDSWMYFFLCFILLQFSLFYGLFFIQFLWHKFFVRSRISVFFYKFRSLFIEILFEHIPFNKRKFSFCVYSITGIISWWKLWFYHFNVIGAIIHHICMLPWVSFWSEWFLNWKTNVLSFSFS